MSADSVGGHLRLLFIEDHDASAAALAEALRVADPRLEIERVGRLHSAAQRLRGNHRYDVVLCDLSLPDADGTEAPALVRELQPDVAVVVLTGHSGTDLALTLVRLGVQDFMPKGEATPAAIARTVRMAYERSRREETAQRVALIDPVSRVLNRRGLDRSILSAINVADRLELPAGLALVDLDNFKQINDRYGHAVGDAVIRQTAERLTHAIRSTDVVGRLGGDEFAVVLTGFADVADLGPIARKLVRRFRHPLRVETLTLEVTVSIGTAAYPMDATSADDWLRCADEAMYAAKRSGKSTYAEYGAASRGDEIAADANQRA